MFNLIKMIFKSYRTGLPVYIQRLEQELNKLQLTNGALLHRITRNEPIHDLYKSLDYSKPQQPIPEQLSDVHELMAKYGYISVIMTPTMANFITNTPSPGSSVETAVCRACYVFSDHSVYIFMESSNEQANTDPV